MVHWLHPRQYCELLLFSLFTTSFAPRPQYVNHSWVRNPGPAVKANTSAWQPLEAYTTAVVAAFTGDPRVLGYDILN